MPEKFFRCAETLLPRSEARHRFDHSSLIARGRHGNAGTKLSQRSHAAVVCQFMTNKDTDFTKPTGRLARSSRDWIDAGCCDHRQVHARTTRSIMPARPAITVRRKTTHTLIPVTSCAQSISEKAPKASQANKPTQMKTGTARICRRITERLVN